ncbi:hypothetical protein MPSEU_000704800 [Mayamaea pseudoterrestris]|nr:hypothetical protein MPSEU_000704800 [Mayamaea pseudoterrestris]
MKRCYIRLAYPSVLVFFWNGWVVSGLPDSTCDAAESMECHAKIGNKNATNHESPTRSLIFNRILAEDYEAIDPKVPKCIQSLKERGAHRCWHKHSTFLEHLIGVHNILRGWNESEIAGRVALFHSAYSNSYVNLALYDPNTERDIMKELVGDQAEELVHMFCIIDRQQVVVNTLLKQGHIPMEGLTVPHLKKANESVFLSAEVLRMLIVFTMADISDQYFYWQDELWGGGGTAGSMVIPGMDFTERHNSKSLWPGMSKPGLWMSYISDLTQVVKTYKGDMSMPPVLDFGARILSTQDEALSRDLYWNVISEQVTGDDEIIATLIKSNEHNPFAFEPLVLLAQKYLHENRYDDALASTERAIELEKAWLTCWDKRMSFGAWVAWTRVMHQKAQERKPWPSNSWEVNNLGLVKNE